MFFEIRIFLEKDLNQMWWFFFLVTGLQVIWVFTRGCPSGKTYCSCFFPSVAFHNKLQNIGLLERDQLQRPLKKDKWKYQLFFRNYKYMVLVCHFVWNFLYIFVSVNLCMCFYVDLVALLNATYWFVCDVLIKDILTSSTTTSKC